MVATKINILALFLLANLLLADEAVLTPMHLNNVPSSSTTARSSNEKVETVINEKNEAEQVPVQNISRPYDLNKIELGPREKNGLNAETIRPQKLKNRIYVRFNTTLNPNRWVADLTDENGYFKSPDRYLVPGAVVPGEWLGAPGSNYELTDIYPPTIKAWKPTTKSLNPNFSVLVGRTEKNEPIRHEEQQYPFSPRPR